jgi:dephospho-CoA kinase
VKVVKNKKLVIAITGPIGSGKTIVLDYLSQQGYPTISADKINQQLLTKKSHIKKINKLLFQTKSNTLNKTAIRELIFKDKTKKKLLESYLHPLIIKEITKKLAKSTKTTFIEVALLYESDFNLKVDLVMAVIASEALIIERIEKRDAISRTLIKEILANQKSISFLKKEADVIINNEKTRRETFQQLDQFLKQLRGDNNGDL